MTQALSPNRVTSPRMEYCATQREYQLGAKGYKKVAAYMVYACGGSFFVGLTRLIAGLGALCVDYKGKAKVQEEWNQNTNSTNTTGNHIVGRMRAQTLSNGIEMCEKDISSHWKQVARAIVELTVVGGWIYAGIEAVSYFQHDLEDPLDWGRCKGMWNRMTSDFKDRQYVPAAMLQNSSASSQGNLNVSNTTPRVEEHQNLSQLEYDRNPQETLRLQQEERRREIDERDLKEQQQRLEDHKQRRDAYIISLGRGYSVGEVCALQLPQYLDENDNISEDARQILAERGFQKKRSGWGYYQFQDSTRYPRLPIDPNDEVERIRQAQEREVQQKQQDLETKQKELEDERKQKQIKYIRMLSIGAPVDHCSPCREVTECFKPGDEISEDARRVLARRGFEKDKWGWWCYFQQNDEVVQKWYHRNTGIETIGLRTDVEDVDVDAMDNEGSTLEQTMEHVNKTINDFRATVEGLQNPTVPSKYGATT